MDTPATLLIVDDDRDLLLLLAGTAEARGYRTVCATTLGQAMDAIESHLPDVAIVDIVLGGESGLDLVAPLKARMPDSEIVVISGTSSLSSAITSYDVPAFAFVEKPFDIDRLFATVVRAVERRRLNLQNRRLLWELQTINEIADGMSRSLELDEVLNGALQRLVPALDATGGSIRLMDPMTAQYEVRATVGPKSLYTIWTDFGVSLPRPSDQVIATRKSIIVDDVAALLPPDTSATLPFRSCISLPMIAGDELLGTLTLGCANPHRFQIADQQLLAIVVGQIVVGIQNAQLHDYVRRGKREWERTFDAINDPIAVFDSRGQLLRGNTALAAHLDRSVTQLRPATCQSVGFCGGGCPSCAVGRALAQDGGRAEITLPDGQIFSVTTFPMLSGAGGASVVQVAKNVTEEIRSARRLRQMSEEVAVANAQLLAAVDQLKSTQAQLLQAEKLSAIGQLVAGVAHELNNPLTSVIGYAQLLEQEMRDQRDSPENRSPEELANDLRRIAEESERAARIVRNLLAFARRQTAARAPHDVADLCERVVALRAYELRLTGVQLGTEFQPGLPNVIADAGQIQQALLNLVLNAEQAMRGRTVKRLVVGARFDAAASAVELHVSDSGHGIDTANLSRIFDPFFTTRDVGEGTGLGLSICYGIVRDHGGHIRVESKVQVGTTFSILLPAFVEDPRTATEDILVAHGDQGEREFLVAALNGWGHRAVGAATITEALDRYRRAGLQAVLLDRGLLAASLPDWRAARQSSVARAPLILLSTTPQEDAIEQFGREEASAVLVPPWELRALRAAVRAVSKECV
jgi:signal transduction histidine kinase/DNA-binding response OmpR family regulator